MRDKIFIDINIIIYQFGKDSFKKNKAINILEKAIQTDSLIVCAALRLKCTKLFSEDLQVNQRIDSMEILNPFL